MGKSRCVVVLYPYISDSVNTGEWGKEEEGRGKQMLQVVESRINSSLCYTSNFLVCLNIFSNYESINN